MNSIGLLPTRSPAGSAVRYGRTVLHWTGRAFGASAVTDDGQHLYYCAPGKVPGAGLLSPVVVRVYHVATGVTTKLATYHRSAFCELAMSGQNLLLDAGTDGAGVTRTLRYDLTTGKSSPIPRRQPWIELAAW